MLASEKSKSFYRAVEHLASHFDRWRLQRKNVMSAMGPVEAPIAPISPFMAFITPAPAEAAELARTICDQSATI